MFYDRFRELCTKNGETPTTVGKKLGYGASTVSNWKRRGNTPAGDVVQAVANYFGVPASVLLGDDEVADAVPIKTTDYSLYDLIDRYRYEQQFRRLVSKLKDCDSEDIQRIINMIQLMNIGVKDEKEE